MSTTSLPLVHRDVARNDVHPVVRQRKLATTILSVGGVGLVALLTVFFGVFGFVVTAASLAFPLLLLWLSSDVLRADEARS